MPEGKANREEKRVFFPELSLHSVALYAPGCLRGIR